MEIKKMEAVHANKVLELSKVFYSSDALDHEVPMELVAENIKAAIGDNDMLTGYVFCEGNDIAGFSYITRYYETEVGGECVQILDLYIDPNYRGRGFATKYFEFIFEKYASAKRFRLEAVADNEKAVSLYRHIGFKKIGYQQMSIDKI